MNNHYLVSVPYIIEDIECSECGQLYEKEGRVTVTVEADNRKKAVKKAHERVKDEYKYDWVGKKIKDVEIKLVNFEDDLDLAYEVYIKKHSGPYLIDPSEIFEKEKKRIMGDD